MLLQASSGPTGVVVRRRNVEALREAVAQKDTPTILSELVLVLAQLGQDRG